MKKILILLIALLATFTLTACTSKTQTDVINSGSKDVSDLLRTLIQKEKEINDLNKKLEECKKSKTK